jgi:hypothetical protein
MDVDKAGRDEQPARIDFFATGFGDGADARDLAIANRNVGRFERAAGTVGNFTAADNQIETMCHGASSRGTPSIACTNGVSSANCPACNMEMHQRCCASARIMAI